MDLLDEKLISGTCSEIIREQGPVNHLIFTQRYRGTDDEWAGEIETSLTATKNVIEQLSDKFADSNQRSIVIVSSIASRLIAGEQPVGYHVAKAGLHQMVRYYAVTLGHLGIRVNSVSPGTIIKDESKDFYLKNQRLQELYNGITPLGRMGTSDDVAGVISFLCSPQSSFVSGQDIVIDGGRSLVWQETLARDIADLDELSVTSRGSQAP
jgi:NAD(P)-dependent dehydrogenase (short-subunit alcohol dehydrogenase family)